MTALGALIRRDIRIALRVGGGALIGVLFFLIVVVLMPFAIGPDLPLLTRLGPAILWLGALLATAILAVLAAQKIAFAWPVFGLLAMLWLTAVFIATQFLHRPETRSAKWFEAMSGVWTLGLYLSLGAIPMLANCC